MDGGYRATGRWPLGSGCQHSAWIVGGCRIFDGDQPRVEANGMPVTRLLFFPSAACEILDTWHSIGLRGTGSHDYAVADVFVPAAHSLSFREPPVGARAALCAADDRACSRAVLAAVPLGIARHAIDIFDGARRDKIATRSQQASARMPRCRPIWGAPKRYCDPVAPFSMKRSTRHGRWSAAGQALSVTQRATLWLASTHAATSARQAAELMFSAGGATSAYTSSGLERCLRDVHAAGQHLTLASTNYEMVGQALLGSDMRATPLMVRDDRSAG